MSDQTSRYTLTVSVSVAPEHSYRHIADEEVRIIGPMSAILAISKTFGTLEQPAASALHGAVAALLAEGEDGGED